MAGARRVLVGSCIATALLLPSLANSKGKTPAVTSDRIIYAEGDSLWSISSDGQDPILLVGLGQPASAVSRIKVAATGSAMVVSIGGYHAWADLTNRTDPAELHFLPCGQDNSPDISPDGNTVLCATQVAGRVAVFTMRPNKDVAIVDREPRGTLFFAGGLLLGVGDQDNLVDLSSETVLAPHRPDRSMVTTPDGKRVLGAYSEDDIDVVYAFRLDGRATKRTLMQAARVVSASASSTWASLQQETDACAVRISGGQYMCWRRYEALDISSGAQSLLLSRAGEKTGRDLFLGSISGTKARKPQLLVSSIEQAAVFWPVPPRSVAPSGVDAERR